MTATTDLDRIAESVRTASGIALKPHNYVALTAAFARAIGPLDSSDLNTALQPGGPLLDRLVDEVSIKETTFLRDRQQLEAIDWHELLIQARLRNDEVRVWSAGCATGEEVYSLAMLACEAFPLRPPPIRIIGTDVSSTALETARTGRYRQRALREVDQARRDRYFLHDGDAYVVTDRLRQLVRFEKHNMVTDLTPPAGVYPCSVVVCRNVFIYFEPTTVEAVVARFRRSLADDGIMIIGAADALLTLKQTSVPRVPPLRKKPTDDRSQVSSVETPRPPTSEGRRDEELARAEAVLVHDPGNSHAHFVRGFVALMSGRPASAIPSLRAALYTDPTFGVAAFMLARAHDACGDTAQARRAYAHSLRILESGNRPPDHLLAQIEVDDIVAACRSRLDGAT